MGNYRSGRTPADTTHFLLALDEHGDVATTDNDAVIWTCWCERRIHCPVLAPRTAGGLGLASRYSSRMEAA